MDDSFIRNERTCVGSQYRMKGLPIRKERLLPLRASCGARRAGLLLGPAPCCRPAIADIDEELQTTMIQTDGRAMRRA
jgi:hypothetical protein